MANKRNQRPLIKKISTHVDGYGLKKKKKTLTKTFVLIHTLVGFLSPSSLPKTPSFAFSIVTVACSRTKIIMTWNINDVTSLCNFTWLFWFHTMRSFEAFCVEDKEQLHQPQLPRLFRRHLSGILKVKWK